MTRRVKVIPRSAKTEIAGEMADGTLKVKIAAPPEKGKANEASVLVPGGSTMAFRGAPSPLSVDTPPR